MNETVFPEHKASLHLTHNQHKAYYEDAAQYLTDRKCDAPQEVVDAMIKGDSIWELQWYPDTPIGFCIVYGPTLESVLKAASPSKPL